MCRTVHAVLQTAICGIQMLVRVFMTVILMIENVIRMLLQTLYNFISFVLQMVSLIPICIVFLLTARLKCFMCGGGGPCPVNRGGTCDCLMSALAFVILFFIFRATGVLDKIFYSLGYAKARPPAVVRFVPTPGDITECSRNDTETMELDYETMSTTDMTMSITPAPLVEEEVAQQLTELIEEDTKMTGFDTTTVAGEHVYHDPGQGGLRGHEDDGLSDPGNHGYDDNPYPGRAKKKKAKPKIKQLKNVKTTILYYLI